MELTGATIDTEFVRVVLTCPVCQCLQRFNSCDIDEYETDVWTRVHGIHERHIKFLRKEAAKAAFWKRYREHRQLAKDDPQAFKSRIMWRDANRRMNSWASAEMLRHAAPCTLLDKFAEQPGTVTFKRPIPFGGNK